MAILNVVPGDTIRTLIPMRVYRWWVSDDTRCAVDLIIRDCAWMYYVPNTDGSFSGEYGSKVAGDPRAVYYLDGVYTEDATDDNLQAAKYPAITSSGDYNYKITHEPFTYIVNQSQLYNYFTDVGDWLANQPETCFGVGSFTVEPIETILPVYDVFTGTWIPTTFYQTVFESGTVSCPIVELPAGTTGTIGYVDNQQGCDGRLFGTVTWDSPLLNHQPYSIMLDDSVSIPYEVAPTEQTFVSEYDEAGLFEGESATRTYTPPRQFDYITLQVYEKVV